MRKLTDARDAAEARRIVDALYVAGIEAEARSETGTEVWVIDHDQLEAAREKIEAIRAGAHDDAALSARADALRKDARKRQADHRQRVHDLRGRWGTSSAPGPGLVTTFLIVGSVIVGMVAWLADSSGQGMWNLTIDHWASTEFLQRVREGEVWRLVTPMFLHFGLLHLGFNMLWLYRLGAQVEHGHGATMMVVLVLASEIPGSLGQYAIVGPGFGGMSGVVYGLFGFVWMYARFDRDRSYTISDLETVLMMGWFVACATGTFGPIANIGHAGGLAAGLLLGLRPYIRHLRATGTRADFSEGSWAATHLTGFRRFRRRFITPYVPLWFLAIAAGVVVYERREAGPARYTHEACDALDESISACVVQLDEDGRRVFLQRVVEGTAAAYESVPGMETEVLCAHALVAIRAAAAELGCAEHP